MFTQESLKFNKKIRKKCKWMTSTLLKSSNSKNQVYKEWIKIDVNDLDLKVIIF